MRTLVKSLAGSRLRKFVPGFVKRAIICTIRLYYSLKFRRKQVFQNPTEKEIEEIREKILASEIKLKSYTFDRNRFDRFTKDFAFPPDYHGGIDSGVWNEKLVEHFLAWDLLGLENYSETDVYVDVAACSSPWAKMLREHKISAIAIDKTKSKKFEGLPFYLEMDATNTDFACSSVSGISLQCAFEMFSGNSDIELMSEIKRILKPGGVALISPLYLHTHLCHFSTPEFYGGLNGDPGSKQYIRKDSWGINFCRFYDVESLKSRILSKITDLKMKFEMCEIVNRSTLPEGVYLQHFIVITK